MIIPCSGQHFITIGQLKWLLWTNEISRDLSLREVSGYPILLQYPYVQVRHQQCLNCGVIFFNILTLSQNGRQFPDDNFICIFLNGDIQSWIKLSLKFFPNGPINNSPWLVQLMAWQATSHYLNQWRLVDWRIYASLGLNELRFIIIPINIKHNPSDILRVYIYACVKRGTVVFVWRRSRPMREGVRNVTSSLVGLCQIVNETE